MSRVAEAPINLSDLVVSHARSAVGASQAAYDVDRRSGGARWIFEEFRPRVEPLAIAVPIDAMSARWLRPSLEGLFRALTLGRGWDSYNARPIAYASAQSALDFLSRYLEPTTSAPAVVPLADGGVQLEWHRGGLDVEIAFSPDDEPELYVADHETGDAWDLDPSSPQFEEIRPLLTRLRAE